MNDHQLDAWLEHAAELRAQGNFEGSIDSLRTVLAHDPDHARAHALLSLSLVATKRLYAARYEARAALLLDADDPLSHYAVATMALSDRKLNVAERHLRTLLALEPEDPANHRLAADLFELANDRNAAHASLETALALDPEDPETLVHLGELLAERGQTDAARRRCDEALAIDPDLYRGHLLAGHLCLREGNIAGAREHSRFALSENPNDADAVRLFASVKARTSRVLAPWWHYNSWLSTFSEGRQIAILLGVFVVYQLLRIVAEEIGAEQAASLLHITWLAVCAYTWVGPAMFRRIIDNELEDVELRDDY